MAGRPLSTHFHPPSSLQQGVKTRFGRPWSRTVLEKIERHSFYPVSFSRVGRDSVGAAILRASMPHVRGQPALHVVLPLRPPALPLRRPAGVF
eukprot:6323070-Pyramimonas_sp.AAC.1